MCSQWCHERKKWYFFHLVNECRYCSPLVEYFITSFRCIEENFCTSNILFGSTHETPWLRTFCNVNVLFLYISFSYQRTRTKLTPTKQILEYALYNNLLASKSASVTFERAHKITFPNDSRLNSVHTIFWLLLHILNILYNLSVQILTHVTVHFLRPNIPFSTSILLVVNTFSMSPLLLMNTFILFYLLFPATFLAI